LTVLLTQILARLKSDILRAMPGLAPCVGAALKQMRFADDNWDDWGLYEGN